MQRAAALCVLLAAVSSLFAEQIVTGTDAGPAAHVKAFDDGSETASFLPYGVFTGGATVARGDVDGDGLADIITGSATGADHVKVFSGQTGMEIRSFFAYGGFTGGVFVAAGDVDGDGFDDIVTGAATGSSHVKVFSGQTGAELASFFAFAGFTGGVRVAAADVDGDRLADVIVGTGAGAVGHVKVFKGTDQTLLASFFAYPGYEDGIFVSGGDIDGDGRAEIVTGAATGAGHVKVFDGETFAETASFFAYDGPYNGGVRVAVGDVNADAWPDLIVGPGAGAAVLKVFASPALTLLDSFAPYGIGYTGGFFVAGFDTPPSATITSNSDLCPSGATIEVTLTGTPPWTLTWSDAVVTSGITTSPYVRTVPSAGIYTITNVEDVTHLSGTTAGEAVVEEGTDGCPLADLSTTKTVVTAGPYMVGQTVTYQITVTNDGPEAATEIVVTDTLPAELTYESATPSQGSCSGTATVTCTLGTLGLDASATITLVARIVAPGLIANTASAASALADPTPANASATVRLTANAPAIPALSPMLLLALAVVLAGAALVRMSWF